MAPVTTQTIPSKTCKPTIVKKIGEVDGTSIPATMVESLAKRSTTEDRFNAHTEECAPTIGNAARRPEIDNFLIQPLSSGKINANAMPIAKLTRATPYNTALIRLSRWQARAATGSVGQGRDRPYQSATPLNRSKALATPNTRDLCSLSQMSYGIAVTRPANAAPAPTATSTAGRTQQTSVAELVSSATPERAALRLNVARGVFRSPLVRPRCRQTRIRESCCRWHSLPRPTRRYWLAPIPSSNDAEDSSAARR